jgi:hypothetical protein
MIGGWIRIAWGRWLLRALAFAAAAALPLLAARPFEVAARLQMLETAHASVKAGAADTRPLVLDPWTYAAHAENIPAAESEFSSILQSIAGQRGVVASQGDTATSPLRAPGLFAVRQEIVLNGEYAAIVRALSDLAAVRPYVLVERAEIERGEAGSAQARVSLLRIVAMRAPS